MLRITVDNLAKTYRTSVALDGVSMSVAGGITCLLGRNGAGKSTLVRLLVGIERPSAGEVVIERDGEQLVELGRFAHIGWLPQTFGYPSRARVRDFVSYAAWLKKVPDADIPDRVRSTLAAVDLEDARDKQLRELSGGMLRRAGLAAAIVHRPSLLVLDEPTAGLDPVQRAEFHRLIARLSKESSVLLATHLLEDVQALGQSVWILDRGRLVWHGTTTELVATAGQSAVTVEALRSGLLQQIGVDER